MTTHVLTNNQLLGIHRRPVSPSASKAGDWIEKVLQEVDTSLQNARIVGGARADLIGQIFDVARAQSDLSAIDQSVSAISPDAMDCAFAFLSVLPDWMTVPEIVGEPEGELSFEWYRDSDHLLAVICGADRVLYFSGLKGKIDRICGKSLFRGGVPEEIIDPLLELGFGKDFAAQAA